MMLFTVNSMCIASITHTHFIGITGSHSISYLCNYAINRKSTFGIHVYPQIAFFLYSNAEKFAQLQNSYRLLTCFYNAIP